MCITYYYRFSTHKAFSGQLSELNDIAGQHEIVAEEMLKTISKTLASFCNELKIEKKKVSCYLTIFRMGKFYCELPCSAITFDHKNTSSCKLPEYDLIHVVKNR